MSEFDVVDWFVYLLIWLAFVGVFFLGVFLTSKVWHAAIGKKKEEEK